MKAINTNGAIVTNANYGNYTHCCAKEGAAMTYTVPLQSVSELQVFVDFGNKKPSTQSFTLHDLCTGETMPFVFQDYVVGRIATGRYYGVFIRSAAAIADLKRFFITMEFTYVDATTGTFVTEVYEIADECDKVQQITACYPSKESIYSVDINGIYHGFTMSVPDSLGNITIRYRHLVHLRHGRIVEVPGQMKFFANKVRNFKTEYERIYEFKSELVPKWYKDYVVAVYMAGVVKVGDQQLMITDSLMEVIDDEDRTWKPWARMKNDYTYYFGCEECVDLSCCAPIVIGAVASVLVCDCSPTITSAIVEIV